MEKFNTKLSHNLATVLDKLLVPGLCSAGDMTSTQW